MDYISQKELKKWDSRSDEKTIKYHNALLELLEKKLKYSGAI